jgi:SNF2 family DNA or RNA helicase
MDKQFEQFLHAFVAQYTTSVFNDVRKCKALLLDHAQNEYIRECRLFMQAVEAGIVRAIYETDDLLNCRKMQTRILHEEYSIAENTAAELVDVICAALNIGAVKEKKSAQKEIRVNDIVHLTSDPNTKGVVMSISDVGDTKQYQVFINGEMKYFYDGQIEPDVLPKKSEKIDIDDLLRTLTARQICSPSSNSLYSLHASRIDFVPYQFRPVLKLIKSDTPRLLIADSVGVGKTIEAGLILKEMQFRKQLDIIIIICPKPLVAERKWEAEMKEKFGEEFTPADSGMLRNIIENYDRDGEWPDNYKRLIIPYSILTEKLLSGKVKDKAVNKLFLENMNPPPFFDLVIVDEAHHIRNSGTQAHKVVRFFCEHADAAVFLTATPIQNGSGDLYALLNLLFPDVVIDMASFNAMAEPNEHINNAVKFLRAGAGHEAEALSALEQAAGIEWGRALIEPNPVYKKAVNFLKAGNIDKEQRVSLINDVESLHSFSRMINRTRRQDIEDFCIRRATTLSSEFTPRQQELYDELHNFISQVMALKFPNLSLKSLMFFLMGMLYRQAASCIFGLAPSIHRIVSRQISDLTEAGLLDEYDEDIESIHIESSFINQIKTKADRVITLADNLPPDDPDSKFDVFSEILKNRQKLANGKTLVFSTFRNTLSYLCKRIKAELKDIRVERVDGSVPDEERRKLRNRFALPKNDKNALDVLLFSEVGSEGLDYQFCNAMINYDLPWNPMRIEQRIGRIDRHGQKSEFVDIYNCITKGTVDAEIYERCFMKIDIFEKNIGELSDILGDIENSINDIVFNSGLTPEERAAKLEKLAVNEAARIEETRKLEEESRNIFGIDLASSKDEIEKAENIWLSPDNIKRLVEGYLEKRLGERKPYIYDDNKKIKLTSDEKTLVYDDCLALLDRKIIADKIWEQYLKSSNEVCLITFLQNEAKERRKDTFITPSHPFARQAARYFSDSADKCIALTLSESNIPRGEYPFLIYSWEYKGRRSRVEFVPVCADSGLNKALLSLLQKAASTEIDFDRYSTRWAALEKQHLSLWSKECGQYKAEVKSNCDFKTESLRRNMETRKLSAQQKMEKVNDTGIINMHEKHIMNLENGFKQAKSLFDAETKKADIHTTLIVKGVLIV